MIDRYASVATQSGAHLVHCCGFDSVPSDLGVWFLQQQARSRWGRPCESVKMRLMSAKGGVSGGTIASGLNLVQEFADDAALRSEWNNPYLLCPDSPVVAEQLEPLIPVKYDSDFQAWAAPFVMADVNTRIVLRSNALQNQAYGRNFHYEEGILTQDGPLGWIAAQGLKLGLDGFILATVLPPSRWLLETLVLPKSGEGPSSEDRINGFYELQFWGQTSEGQSLTVQVRGDRDPGYGSTAKIVAQAGICLAKDIADNGQPGGSWTPASLLGQALIERLEKYAGLSFSVIG